MKWGGTTDTPISFTTGALVTLCRLKSRGSPSQIFGVLRGQMLQSRVETTQTHFRNPHVLVISGLCLSLVSPCLLQCVGGLGPQLGSPLQLS